MRLFIVRHGKAEHGTATDRERTLTAKGQQQARWLGDWLKESGQPPEALVSSCYPRAAQTAALIGQAIGLTPVHDDRLICGSSASAAIDLIEELCKQSSNLSLVGHNPQVSELVSVLCRGPAGGSVSMRTGEMAVLECKPDHLAGGCVLAALVRRDRD